MECDEIAFKYGINYVYKKRKNSKFITCIINVQVKMKL